MNRHIGVDIGGTFTDIVCISSEGTVLTRKVSSTVDDYSRSISENLPELLEADGGPLSSIREIVHGTTVATNAILERNGAKTGLITTKGFRDVLELRRIRMPELYNWLWDKPPDLVERRHRWEVAERIDGKGRVLTPLDKIELKRCLTELVAEGIESLAVCFLNSYANPRHEEETAALVRKLHPGLRCSVSSEILREMKEYERTATVVVNAYVLPLVQDYVRSLRSSLDQIDIAAPLLIMQSNGGTMTAEACTQKPVFAIESGPAAGVIASLGLVRKEEIPNSITFDMGGTTAKASIIEDGRLNMASEYEVGSSLSMVSRLIKGSGHLIRVPAIDIAEVGAGGGSIAWVDQGGALQVGPRSAGANPGPVCYDIGGERVTITDANLVLGYVNPAGLAGGTISLNRGKSEGALINQVGKPLGMELLECAHGVHLIANSNMMRAIRSVSTERGRGREGLCADRLRWQRARPCRRNCRRAGDEAGGRSILARPVQRLRSTLRRHSARFHSDLLRQESRGRFARFEPDSRGNGRTGPPASGGRRLRSRSNRHRTVRGPEIPGTVLRVDHSFARSTSRRAEDQLD